MLLKLLKLDIKSSYKFYLITFSLAAIIAFIGHKISIFEYNTFYYRVASHINILAAFGGVASGITYMLIKFHKIISGTCGYFTFMIPVPISKHLISKILTAYIFFLLSLLVHGGLYWLSLSYLDRAKFISSSEVIDFFFGQYSSVFYGILLIIVLLIDALFLIIGGYLCVSFGNKFNKNKASISIIAFISLIAVQSIASIVISNIITSSNDTILKITIVYFLTFSIVSLAISAISFALTNNILKKELNLN